MPQARRTSAVTELRAQGRVRSVRSRSVADRHIAGRGYRLSRGLSGGDPARPEFGDADRPDYIWFVVEFSLDDNTSRIGRDLGEVSIELGVEFVGGQGSAEVEPLREVATHAA